MLCPLFAFGCRTKFHEKLGKLKEKFIKMQTLTQARKNDFKRGRGQFLNNKESSGLFLSPERRGFPKLTPPLTPF